MTMQNVAIGISLFTLGLIFGYTYGTQDTVKVWIKPEAECIQPAQNRMEPILFNACASLAVQVKQQNDYLRSFVK